MEQSTLTLTENPEHFINSSEKKYNDITPGTEKTIVWHDNRHKQKTKFSIIYLHGFSASRQEIAPVCENLAHQLQVNLFLTRLTGHGRPADAMREITVDKLLHDAQEAISVGRSIGEKVIVVGTSTGATLATWLALEDKQNIHALVFVSPNFGLKRKDSELLLWPFARWILKYRQGETYRFTPDNEGQQKYWTTEYPSEALLPLMQLLKVVRRIPLEKIDIPLLTLYCEQDQLVDVKAIKKTFQRFGSNNKILQCIHHPQGSQKHILAGDIISPDTTQEVIDRILEFIKKL